MTNIKGERLITISADANKTYIVDYGATYTVSILNHTDDAIIVSDRPNYPNDGVSAGCIKIAANAFFNNLTIPGPYLYITSIKSGDITIIRAV